MKKLIIKTFIFSAIILGLYLVLIFALSNIRYKSTPLIAYTSNYYPSKGGHTFQSLNELLKDDDFDLFFLGSSHAYRGFDPRIFNKNGLKTHNLGTSGQNLESTEIMCKRIIASKKVKTLVLEVYSGQLEKEPAINESTFDIAINAPTNKICFDYIINEQDWRFVNLLFYKLLSLSSKPVYTDTTYVGSGYSERTDSALDQKFIYKTIFKPSPDKLAALERIMQLTKKNDQQLILVSHPLPKQYPKDVHNNFKQYITPLLQKYKIQYFDYTSNHNLNANYHFYDYNHMNQAGVAIFDSILIQNKDFRAAVNGKRN